MYEKDGVEFTINSFVSGLKFNLSIVDGKPVVKRDKFVGRDVEKVYDEETVPRSIVVNEDAAAFPERAMIEDIYGIDLSGTSVIVYEMKLPLNDKGAFLEPIGSR